MHDVAQDLLFGLYHTVALSTYARDAVTPPVERFHLFTPKLRTHGLKKLCVFTPSPTPGSHLSTLCLCCRGFSRYLVGVGLSLFVLL